MNIVAVAIFSNAAAAAFDGPAQGVGLGIVGGDPNGLTVAWRPDDAMSIQTAAGWSTTSGMVKVNTDYIVTLRDMTTPTDQLRITVYAGGGARLRIAGEAKVQKHNESGIGARIPIGLRGVPAGKKLDFFVEVAPSMMLLPDTSAGLDFGLGARLWTGNRPDS